MIVARVAAHSPAGPDAVWKRLVDTAAWPAWDAAIAWTLLEGELRAGTYLTVKPRQGRQTAYRIAVVEPPRTLAFGLRFGPVAALEHRWQLDPAPGGGTEIVHTIAVHGPLAGLLAAPLARRAAASAGSAVAALAAENGRRGLD